MSLRTISHIVSSRSPGAAPTQPLGLESIYSRIERLYTFREVAELLRVHIRTVERRVKTHDYEVVRLGRVGRLKARTVEEIIEHGWEDPAERAARAER